MTFLHRHQSGTHTPAAADEEQPRALGSGGDMATHDFVWWWNHAGPPVSTTRGLNACAARKQLTPSHEKKKWISGNIRAYDLLSGPESDVVDMLRAAHPAMIQRLALHDPIRRAVALVVAMSFHLFVLILMVWPAIRERGTPVGGSHPHAIHIRFLRLPWLPAAPAVASAASRVIPPALHVRTTSAQPSKPQAVPYPTRAASLPAEKRSLNPPAASPPITGINGAISDGGFQDQLLKAQHAYAIHGIPGSGKPFVPGIRLIDPRTQGAGATMRQAQRLFGIANRHCVDVDVWRNLTPLELIARHISPGEVDKTDETYHCNQPLGLSF